MTVYVVLHYDLLDSGACVFGVHQTREAAEQEAALYDEHKYAATQVIERKVQDSKPSVEFNTLAWIGG